MLSSMLNAFKFGTSFESQSNQGRVDSVVLSHCEIDMTTLILYKEKKNPCGSKKLTTLLQVA